MLDAAGILANQFNLVVNGTTSTQVVTAAITVFKEASVDLAVATHSVAQNFTAVAVPTFAGPLAGAGVGVLGFLADGRVEGFHIDTATFRAGAPHIFNVQIVPYAGTQGISVTGIAGATIAPNGSINLSVTPDAGGNIAIPPALLAQFGTDNAQIRLNVIGLEPGTALTGSILLRDAVPNPDGVYVQTFGADGVALDQPTLINDAATTAALFGDAHVEVTALAGGAYMAHWTIDTDGDGEGDTIAIQRFAADGSKDGGIVTLDGIAAPTDDSHVDIESYDLTPLADGSYALAYNIELQTAGRAFSFSGNPGVTAGVPIVGAPYDISFSGPAGLQIVLRAFNTDGSVSDIPVTVVDGHIHVTEKMLADAGVTGDQFNLLVSGFTAAGQTVSGFIQVEKDAHVDLAAPTHEVASTFNVGPSSITSGSLAGSAVGVLGLIGSGRVEGFHVNALTAHAGSPLIYNLQVITTGDGHALNLTGLTGAVANPLGYVQMSVTPDASGNIAVPPSLLAQLGDDIAQIRLVIVGLEPGSTLSGSIMVRDAVDNPDGLYVQTFGADGHALSADLHLLGTAGGDALTGDWGADVLDPLGGTNVLTGGAGADTFHFTAASTGSNLITDFQQGSDRIDFSALDANAGTPAHDPLHFLGSAAFDGSSGALRFEVIGGNTLVETDLDGDHQADVAVLLSGVHTLVQADFIL